MNKTSKIFSIIWGIKNYFNMPVTYSFIKGFVVYCMLKFDNSGYSLLEQINMISLLITPVDNPCLFQSLHKFVTFMHHFNSSSTANANFIFLVRVTA